ncbi:hypothetical protein [Pseudidiomarina homiensis]|uniref:Uncharacterized protein n=1 Tax=Pseudidiomarina homiensis TaxID=364198 RepID=A0A432Y3A8_9GAMM|nr:hypothetical protein [Pseudidiomarina homiensis]RUO55386.1 hypothetical protein CWI70_00965 [Pseudidiomarina homiensis]
MEIRKFALVLMACAATTPAFANAISGDNATEKAAETVVAHDANINAAKAKFGAYIQANYGNTFSCGARLLTPDEALMYRYTAGEIREVASFSDALKITDYTPIYDLAKLKARPAVVSHTYYIEDE